VGLVVSPGLPPAIPVIVNLLIRPYAPSRRPSDSPANRRI
jgi:hypothetical protein